MMWFLILTTFQVYPEGHVTPGIMIANTDTRHYQHLSDNTFRFSPTFLMKTDLDRFHGLNERISVDNYAQVSTAGLQLSNLSTFFQY